VNWVDAGHSDQRILSPITMKLIMSRLWYGTRCSQCKSCLWLQKPLYQALNYVQA